MNFKDLEVLENQNVKDIATTFIYIGSFLIFVVWPEGIARDRRKSARNRFARLNFACGRLDGGNDMLPYHS